MKIPIFTSQVVNEAKGGTEATLTVQLKDGLLVPEDPLGIVAQLADVLRIEEEVAFLRGLPGPWTEQLVDHTLVSALQQQR